MKKSLFIVGVIFVFAACNNGGADQEKKTDTSASSSADSIRNAVENLPMDSANHQRDSALGKDSLKK